MPNARMPTAGFDFISLWSATSALCSSAGKIGRTPIHKTLLRRLSHSAINGTRGVFSTGLPGLNLGIQLVDDRSFAIAVLFSLLPVIHSSKRDMGFHEVRSVLEQLL